MSLQLIGSGSTGSTLLNLNGKVSQTFSYGACGGTNNLQANLLGFNGERRDPTTGTTHLGNGYRAYSPVLMRFTCPDSFSPFGEGGINAYVYCEGDPVNNVDPSGHALFKKVLTAIDTVFDTVQEIGSTPKVTHGKGRNIGAMEAQSATADAVQAPEEMLKRNKVSALRHVDEVASETSAADNLALPKMEAASTSQDIVPKRSIVAVDNPDLARRDILAACIPDNYHGDSIYIQGVSTVNQILKNAKIGLSESAFESISENIRLVNTGGRTESAASLREFRVFARDALTSLRAGEYKNAGVTAAGSAINLAGGTLFLPLFDRAKFPIWQRALYDAMDFIQ
ncbi:RHS repeat-associated core domain-containing protein [Buttiauxella gaviniae]|uniref:RHS repeat-associated core domain-containing protein n=1 Tax=Buttiauxella gaviniae TaxID=82990 RepID=A0ABV3NSA1_9ENTR